MSDLNQAKRWSTVGVGVVVLLVLLVGSSSYVAISQAVALCRLRIAAARDDAVVLRVSAIAEIDAVATRTLTLAADRYRAGKRDGPADAPGELGWLGSPYVWNGLDLAAPRTGDAPADTTASRDAFDRFVENVLNDVLGEEDETFARPVAFLSRPFGDRSVVLACMVARDASLSPFALAATVDLDKLKTDILDPHFVKSDKICIVKQPSRSDPAWREAIAKAFDPLSIEPAPSFVSAQRRGVAIQVSLYAAVTALFGIALVVMVRRFLATVEREVALSQLKSSFAADVSHELKTPLALIRMFSEMLSENRVPTEEKKQEYYGIITRESARLTRLIDNILDFSRIEAGKKAYDFHAVDPAQIVRSTYDTYRFDLEHRGFEHALRIDDDLPKINADADAIGQAILNLVSNAVKYSRDEKRVDIEVTKETRRGKHGVLISVKDSGIGINPEDRVHLFDGFFRAGDDRVRRVRGAGLGLSVVKHIVEAHGGIVDVESRLVKGTTFRIFLPESAEIADAQSGPHP